MEDDNRQQSLSGTKCETCCDADWCWNSLSALRNDCLGPFKDIEDFRAKWREFQALEKQKTQLERYERKLKYDMFRELRSYCEHKKEMAEMKRRLKRAQHGEQID